MTTRLGRSSLYTVNVGVCAPRTWTCVTPASSLNDTARTSFRSAHTRGDAPTATIIATAASNVLELMVMATPAYADGRRALRLERRRSLAISRAAKKIVARPAARSQIFDQGAITGGASGAAAEPGATIGALGCCESRSG